MVKLEFGTREANLRLNCRRQLPRERDSPRLRRLHSTSRVFTCWSFDKGSRGGQRYKITGRELTDWSGEYLVTEIGARKSEDNAKQIAIRAPA
jgi:hypothetical protein